MEIFLSNSTRQVTAAAKLFIFPSSSFASHLSARFVINNNCSALQFEWVSDCSDRRTFLNGFRHRAKITSDTYWKNNETKRSEGWKYRTWSYLFTIIALLSSSLASIDFSLRRVDVCLFPPQTPPAPCPFVRLSVRPHVSPDWHEDDDPIRSAEKDRVDWLTDRQTDTHHSKSNAVELLFYVQLKLIDRWELYSTRKRA